MRLRVMTYNVHKCVGGLDRRHDPVRVAETIAFYEPDVVLLQEVVDADVLGDLLKLPHRSHFPNVTRLDGCRYGNAVLSRYPIAETSWIDLTIGPKKKRGALHARIVWKKTLHVYNLHLGLSGIERRLQLRRFLASHPFAGLHVDTPILVGGDFNDVWGTLGKAILAPAGFRGSKKPSPTFPAFAPMRALDALYLRGAATLEREHRARSAAAKRASDHLPVVADILISG